LEFCEWIENSNRRLRINGEVINESWATNMTLEDSTVSSALYGFWRNETSIFIRTSEWLFMEGTVFKYICNSLNPNPKCGSNLNMPEMRMASGLPLFKQYSMLVKILAEIYNLKVEFFKKCNVDP
jgi:hypothetical protein